MRRAWRLLLLALCLVFSQEGALLHALKDHAPVVAGGAPPGLSGSALSGSVSPGSVSFGSTSRGSDSHGSESHGADTVCALCLAFAHLAGLAGLDVVAPTLIRLEHDWTHAREFRPLAAVAPRPRARDPPIVG